MRIHPSLLLIFALTALVSVASVRADDDQDGTVTDKPLKVEARVVVASEAGGTHWIGVYAVPIEAALKSHLGIDQERLIVQEVMDDSPAKKAGMREHDVLLKFGDTTIATVEDLMTAVGESEGEATSVKLIRGGKEKSLQVTPEERPENLNVIRVDATELGNLQGLLGRWVQDQGEAEDGHGNSFKFRILGPGVVDSAVDVKELHKALARAHGKMPKNLKIEVKKEGDTPAKITVTRDGETWEVTEENLDDLPDDVRPHVRGSVGGRTGVAFGFAPNGTAMRLKALNLHSGGNVVREYPLQPAKRAAVRAIQIRELPQDVNVEVEVDADVKQLRQDVEALKKAVKKLQENTPRRKREKQTN